MRYHARRITILAWVLAASIAMAQGKELPRVKPAEVGMSAAKLAKVDEAAEKLIAQKRLAGAVVVFARGGKIAWQKSYGMMDIEAKKPMRDDTIFRIYSMSKAVTSVAALMLVDEGKLDLDAPVSQYIPAFKGLKVYHKDGNVTPKREMIVRDLLRHTSGLVYGITRQPPVDPMYLKANVLDRNTDLAEMCRRLGKLPLAYEPGTEWRYSIAVDVLGRVVEVVSKKTLDQFFAERVFQPLDMKDTAFFVPDAKLDRFAANYTGRGGKLTVRDAPATSRYRTKPVRLSGGGGLVSTARDYTRFVVMLANGGELHGVRLLKRDTVKLMTSNQLPKGIGWIRLGAHRVGTGFGLGLAVRIERSRWDAPARVGECSWDGAASTHFWFRPSDKLVVVTMEQTQPFTAQLERAIKGLIYDAIEKSPK